MAPASTLSLATYCRGLVVLFITVSICVSPKGLRQILDMKDQGEDESSLPKMLPVSGMNHLYLYLCLKTYDFPLHKFRLHSNRSNSLQLEQSH